MKTVNKLLALLLTLALLVSVPVVAFAEETVADLFPAKENILNSITTEEKTGNGLAFLFEMNVRGATANPNHVADYTNAKATVDGVEYSVVGMGAVMANQAADIAVIDTLTRENANDGKTILDVPAVYLYDIAEDGNSCTFAVRIVRVPEMAQGNAIGARPYVVLKNGDEEITLYGNSDMATYNQVYYANNEEETPVLDLSKLGNVDNKIAVSASAVYEAICPTTYKEGFKVSLILENVSANAKTSAGDYVTYSCKDAEGNELGSKTVDVDVLAVGGSKKVEFYAPIGTASIAKADADLNYVPDITLPAIGSDIDVTKKKNRIRVSAAEASFNEDGSIHVALTFKNYTSNWITEETDYVKYSYYKGTTRKGTATIYIGVIDTKKNPIKTFEFDVPDYTTEVRLTSSKIVYWTEWA